MSRIGKKPVNYPSDVKVNLNGREITVEGKLGTLSYTHRPEIKVEVDQENREIVCSRSTDVRDVRAYHGLTRALLANMVVGVSQGYEKKLEIQGVGYLGAIAGDVLQ